MFWLRNKKIIFSYDSYLGASPIVQLHCKSWHAGALERSGSVVECLTGDGEARAQASPASLCCVPEPDTLILA